MPDTFYMMDPLEMLPVVGHQRYLNNFFKAEERGFVGVGGYLAQTCDYKAEGSLPNKLFDFGFNMYNAAIDAVVVVALLEMMRRN